MNQSWRPKGWANPFTMRVSTDPASQWADNLQDLRLNAFEAGADAMLEALKKEGKYIDASKYPYGMVLNKIPPVQELTRKFKGWLIIIPNNEVEVPSH